MSMGGFERVRQLPRQDVYCNGLRHVLLVGEQFGRGPILKTCPPAEVRVTACDCPRPSVTEKVPA